MFGEGCLAEDAASRDDYVGDFEDLIDLFDGPWHVA